MTNERSLKVLASDESEWRERSRSVSALELTAARPGELCETIEIMLPPALRADAGLSAVQCGVRLDLLLVISAEAERVLRRIASAAQISKADLAAHLDRCSSDQATVYRDSGGQLATYAETLRAGLHHRPVALDGPVALRIPHSVVTAWGQDARMRALAMHDWVVELLADTPFDRASWEAAAADRAQSLEAWAATNAVGWLMAGASRTSVS